MTSEDTCLCFTLNLSNLTSRHEPTSLSLRRCGVSGSQRQRCFVAINNSNTCSLLTSWNTPENNPPPPATRALIQLARTVYAIWNSPLQACSRLDPNTCGVLSWDSALLTLCFLQQGPVFFYYGLSNYFQNFRKYAVSKDDQQLYGDLNNFKASEQMYPSSSYYFHVFFQFLSLCSIKNYMCIFL